MKTMKALSVKQGWASAICVARLVDCRTMVEADEAAACCRIYPGAFAWVLEDIRPVEPFEIKGKLGLFEVELPEGAIV